MAGGKLGDRAALAAIKAVSEWIKAEGERLTADVLPELQKQIDELREQAENSSATLRSV